MVEGDGEVVEVGAGAAEPTTALPNRRSRGADEAEEHGPEVGVVGVVGAVAEEACST